MKLIALVFLCLFIFHVTLTADWPIPGHGVTDPSSFYQRSRHSKYPHNKPFFHWYYMWLHNLKTGQNYAFCYATSYGGSMEGAYFLFAQVTPSDQITHSQQIFKYPVQSVSLSEKEYHFDASQIGFEAKQTDFEKSSQISFSGEMDKDSPHEWIHIGQSQHISWNITLDREYGYYGQDIFEFFDEHMVGIIQWNTYGHFSKIHSGQLVIDGEQIDLSKDYIAYCDENWGTQFPQPPTNDIPENKYAWGWYRVVIPSQDEHPSLAIIAGIGLTYSGTALLGSMYGKFADVRYSTNSSMTKNINLREVEVYAGTILEQKMESTNDGRVRNFDVERKDWIIIKDEFGNASIPLTQILRMETDHLKVEIAFESREDQYNRLIFPFNEGIFSDFEALGVTAHINVEDTKAGVKFKETVHNGGLEYGRKFPIHVPSKKN